LGNNSCGIHSLMSVNEGYGPRTSDNTESLTVLTYDGLKMEVGPTSEEKLEQIIQEGGRKGEIYENLRDLRDKYADEIREEFPKKSLSKLSRNADARVRDKIICATCAINTHTR